MKTLRHPTSDELLRHLDGECDPRVRKQVEEHLGRCWKCRTRSAELQRHIHSVTTALQDESWPSAEHQELAQRRLQGLIARESGSAPTQPKGTIWRRAFQARSASLLPRWAWVAGMAATATIFLWMGHSAFDNHSPDPSFAAVPHAQRTALAMRFAQWDTADTARLQPALPRRGSMQVRVTDRVSGELPRQATVEWIADFESGRSAFRWLEDRGSIRLAAWQPALPRSVSYVYRQREWATIPSPAANDGAIPIRSVLGVAQLEDQVLGWVQLLLSRESSPALRFAALGARAGSLVETRSDGSYSWACVSIKDGDGEFENCLKFAVRSGLVVYESLRFLSFRHELEVRIPWDAAEGDRGAMTMLADFFPPGLERLDQEYASLSFPRGSPAPLRAEHPQYTVLLPALLNAEEALNWLDVHGGEGFALRLSMEEQAIRVGGRASTREQLELTRRTFEDAVPPGMLRFDVQSSEDAALPPMAAPSDNVASNLGAPRALEDVARTFPQWSETERRDYCNRVVRLSGQVVAEATALEEISQRYSPEVEKFLAPEDRQRLADLRLSRAARFRAQAGVLLDQLAEMARPASDPVARWRPRLSDGSPWQNDVREMASRARALHAQVLAFFAVDSGASSGATVTVEGVRQGVVALLSESTESVSLGETKVP